MKIVKVEKGYEYIPYILISRIFNRRINDADSVTRHISLNESNPALISPTIAHIPPPATKEIVQKKKQICKWKIIEMNPIWTSQPYLLLPKCLYYCIFNLIYY